MLLYIDPGTGSMLFTILIGLLGALIYALRETGVKLKYLFHGGKVNKSYDSHTIVLFTDSKRYWNIFKPICDEMERRSISALYLTASSDDPLLKEKYEHIKTEFAGEGNKAFARMNMLKADIVLSSTPSLDVYQWKRSKSVKWYVHVLHAAGDVTLYRFFGTDYYDAVLLSGEYQIKQIKDLEVLRMLPPKELRLVGLPHMDTLRKRLLEAKPVEKHETTILLAPSWGPSSIIYKYGDRLIRKLQETGYSIIIRPHPQSYISDREIVDSLMKNFPGKKGLKWDRNIDNFEVLQESDLLISDFSSVFFDYAMVFDKPIIYADTSFDNGIYDSWWLNEKEWIFTVLDRIGLQLTEGNMENIKQLIDQCLNDNRFKDGRDQIRAEGWANIGNSVNSIVDYLEEKIKEISTFSETL